MKKIIFNKKNKKAQEEIVGLAVIIVLVMVILLIFLRITLSKDNETNLESYEVSSFINSYLRYTTECRDTRGFVDMENLIAMCSDNENCIDEKNSCELLKELTNGIFKETIDRQTAILGYDFTIFSEDIGQNLLKISSGNQTRNYKTSPLRILGSGVKMELKIFY